MAHFIGYLQGNRGRASRLGTKKSGIDAQAQSWEIGGCVELDHNKNEKGEYDELRLFVTGGSNHTKKELIEWQRYYPLTDEREYYFFSTKEWKKSENPNHCH